MKSPFSIQPKKPKRWQEDEVFVRWLVSKQYAQFGEKRKGVEVQAYLTLGTMLYLYEAWAAGVAQGNGAETCT
jgi:hypothetical protein